MSRSVEPVPFLIDDRPLCIWGTDLTAQNLDFLENIDPKYFDHLVQVHVPLLDSEQKHYAAAALRSAYSQGLETLFALTCALVQAPDGMAAWMTLYENKEVVRIVAAVAARKRPGPARTIHEFTFSQLAAHVHQAASWAGDGETAERFATLWERFAQDFLDEGHTREYNSFKHGLRASMDGGFSLAMGVEDTPGVPAPAHKMHSLGSSEFGARYFETVKLAPYNHRLVKQSVNWHPLKYAAALQLIAISINNVLACAKIAAGEAPDSVSFIRLTDPREFEEPWKHRSTIARFQMNPVITTAMIQPMSKSDILTAVGSLTPPDASGGSDTDS